MNSFLKELLSGPSGKVSSMRTSSLLVVLSVLFCLVYTTVTDGKSPKDIPAEAWAALVGTLAVKGWQRGKEHSKQSDTNNL